MVPMIMAADENLAADGPDPFDINMRKLWLTMAYAKGGRRGPF